MKGISPLLASILLIAITVTVASLVSGWTTSTFSSSQSDVSNKTTAALSCSSSAITIDKVFIGAGDNGTASVVVRNSGSVDNVIVTSAQLYDRLGNNFTANNTLTLNVGQLGTLTFKMPHGNNVTTDSSALGNNATCYAMSTGNQICTYALSGKSGSAMSFDGSDDSVNLTNTVTLGNFSIGAWVNPNLLSNSMVIAANSLSGLETNGFRLYINSWMTGNGYITFEVGDGTSGTAPSASVIATSGAWQHIMWVYNTTHLMIYVNGIRTLSSETAINFAKSGTLVIGRLRSGWTLPFRGLMDDVQVWNRTLTGNEINQSMSMGASAVANVNDRLLWLKFDEGKGILSCPSDFSSVRVTTQCADAQDVYTAMPSCG